MSIHTNITTLAGTILMIGSICLAEESGSRPIVGAIRWDAWTGGEVTAQVERSLGPQKYHSRLPWFARVADEGHVHIDGSPQVVMDQEIAFASNAGLNYWAFLLYPEASTMSQALGNYLKSAQRDKIKFCVILHNSFGVSEEQWPKERDRAVALLKEPGYQTVLAGRPLVFAFEVRFRGNFPAHRFADFRSAARQAGVNPYCVFMGWNPASDFQNESAKGFDAVSAYAYGSADATFAGLCQAVEKQYWQNAIKAGVPYVPLVTTGWDKQPRKENPVSWERGHSYHQQAVFPSAATPLEITSHLERAISFVKKNNKVCAANAIIIYSWNEHDEGGWLVPTWTPSGHPNTERLDAIGKILNGDITDDAHKTYAAYVRAINAGVKKSSDDIPPAYWADGIKSLNPVKVYTHRVNIVIVQRIRDGTEEGKYIYIPVSSYLPQTGDDGFVFSPNPRIGNTYTLGNGIFDFKRTRSVNGEQ